MPPPLTGRAMPTVLIPGLLATADLYGPQLSALWSFGAVQIADTRRAETIEEMAAQALAAAPSHFALVGLSMGGYVAMEMIRQAPDRIGRVALLDTSARADTPEQTERRLALVEETESGGFGAVVENIFAHAVHPDRRGDEALRGLFHAMAFTVGPEAFVRQQGAIMARREALSVLPSCTGPALVAVGEEDLVTPPARAREIADGLSGSRLLIVPGCGHVSTLERPDRITAALIQWLRVPA